MAKHIQHPKNCSSGVFFLARPMTKMGSKTLSDVGPNLKKFCKRYTSKKVRKYKLDIIE